MVAQESLIADSMVEVLARIIAEKTREFEQMLAVRDAETKAFQAQLNLMTRETLDRILAQVQAACDQIKNGKDGIDGLQGPVGPTGPQGPAGPAGPAGLDGLPGQPGPQGLAGDAGPRGLQGPQGEVGPIGQPGPQGPEGLMGPIGLAGPRGEKGDRGEQGEIGLRGEKGEKGIDGRDGQPGRDGLNGLQGERGAAGKDGINGKDGTDGAGFDTWEATYDNERTFTITAGSGERSKQFSFLLPIPIFRGRYKQGETYQRGDEVMWGGGNIYRCLKETIEKPNDSGEFWCLAANRGRDGRDGKDGERGPQGPEGKPGRDLTQLGPDGKKW